MFHFGHCREVGAKHSLARLLFLISVFCLFCFLFFALVNNNMFRVHFDEMDPLDSWNNIFVHFVFIEISPRDNI